MPPQVAPRAVANPTLAVKSTFVRENFPAQRFPRVAPPPNSSTFPPSLFLSGKPAFHSLAFGTMITSGSAIVISDRASTKPKSSALNEKKIAAS